MSDRVNLAERYSAGKVALDFVRFGRECGLSGLGEHPYSGWR
ncbi:hypothetical protein [[Kitasatospora] papulosa]